MPRKHRFESPALRHAYERYVGDDADQRAAFDDELANAEVARKLYDLRTQARLTQVQLAKRLGTTASVISRLEDATYEGHSLSMLRRIAAVLERRVELRFIPLRRHPVKGRKAGAGSPHSVAKARKRKTA